MEQYQRLLSSSFRILAIRSHSIQELKTKLSRKTNDDNSITQVITYLTEKGYLNDTEFAKSFVNSRLSRHLGPALLKYELGRRGIAPNIINQVLKKTLDVDSQLNLARSFLDKKFPISLPFLEFRKKAYPALMRKGFGSQAISSAIDERRKKK